MRLVHCDLSFAHAVWCTRRPGADRTSQLAVERRDLKDASKTADDATPHVVPGTKKQGNVEDGAMILALGGRCAVTGQIQSHPSPSAAICVTSRELVQGMAVPYHHLAKYRGPVSRIAVVAGRHRAAAETIDRMPPWSGIILCQSRRIVAVNLCQKKGSCFGNGQRQPGPAFHGIRTHGDQ